MHFPSESWHIREIDERAVARLVEEVGIRPVTARVLAGRGVVDPTAAVRFLAPSLGDLPDPSSIPDMDAACRRIAQALASGERIALFGDYDVDGVSAAALLAEFFEALGHRPLVALPNRFERGYGLSPEAVDELSGLGARLIVTVDNGTRAAAAIARARELRIDVVVTDHHEAGGELPPACAVVNPRRLEACAPFAALSGCGVAFMLAAALRRHLREAGALPLPEPNLRRLLDLVALGTIADVMPLAGVNRLLTHVGLAELANAQRPGIRALLEVASTEPSSLSADAVAFRLAPRLNAAGRLGSAMRAFELLRTGDREEAQRIASELDCANRERQKLEEAILREAENTLARAPAGPAVVVHGDDWHVGVLGIVAAKLADRTGRPAVVISRGLAPARGSARSPDGMNLLEALSDCGDLLEHFGGHATAAGLTIEADRIALFAERFAAACARIGSPEAGGGLAIDALLDPRELDFGLLTELERLRPFGCGNPPPLFALDAAEVRDPRVVGNGHLKLRLEACGSSFDAIGFNMAELLPLPARVRVAATPERNTWNGTTSLQLKLKAIAGA